MAAVGVVAMLLVWVGIAAALKAPPAAYVVECSQKGAGATPPKLKKKIHPYPVQYKGSVAGAEAFVAAHTGPDARISSCWTIYYYPVAMTTTTTTTTTLPPTTTTGA